MAADAEKAMATVREASEEARGAIADFRGDKGPVKGLTGDLQQTLPSARDAMADLAETTEALKRNFLFRGFFNRRGYFDLDDVSVGEYRQGALESKDRRVLRIWLGADVLFETDANGGERLSRGREDAARFRDVAVRAVSAEESVRGRRICTGRDRRRALSHQPQPRPAGPRLRRRQVQARPQLRGDHADGGGGAGKPDWPGHGMASRWRCSCLLSAAQANQSGRLRRVP